MADRGELDRFGDLESTIDAITDYGIATLDADGTIASWSLGAQALTGYTANEVIGQPVSIFFTDGDKAAGLVEHSLETAAANGRFEFEGPRVRNRGESFWVRGVLAPVRDRAGTLTGFVSVLQDVSERKQAEAVSARLAAIVRSSDDAMFSMTPDGVISAWNAGAEHLLGHSEAGIVGRHVEVLIPQEARADFDLSIKRLQAGEHAVRYDSWRRRKDGSLVEVAVSLSAIRDSTESLIGYAAVLRDLTERRRAEEELAAARGREEIFRERDRIARDLHDLVIQRLFAAGMAIEAVLNLVSDAELASRLRGVVDELDATISATRSTIFALDQGPEPTSSLRTQLLAVVSDLAEALGFEPRIEFVGPIDTVVPAKIAEHVLAVAREALSNVARHARASAVEICLHVGDEIVLEVTDDGGGVGGVPRKSGLLGLADRAEKLGGAFSITSEDGGGTRLSWSVPARPAG